MSVLFFLLVLYIPVAGIPDSQTRVCETLALSPLSYNRDKQLNDEPFDLWHGKSRISKNST